MYYFKLRNLLHNFSIEIDYIYLCLKYSAYYLKNAVAIASVILVLIRLLSHCTHAHMDSFRYVIHKKCFTLFQMKLLLEYNTAVYCDVSCSNINKCVTHCNLIFVSCRQFIFLQLPSFSFR